MGTINKIIPFFNHDIKVEAVISASPELFNSEGKTLGELIGDRASSLSIEESGPDTGSFLLRTWNDYRRNPSTQLFIHFNAEA